MYFILFVTFQLNIIHAICQQFINKIIQQFYYEHYNAIGVYYILIVVIFFDDIQMYRNIQHGLLTRRNRVLLKLLYKTTDELMQYV